MGSTGGEVSCHLTQPGFPRDGGQQRPSAKGAAARERRAEVEKDGMEVPGAGA